MLAQVLIRDASVNDAKYIADLLLQMGYPQKIESLAARIERLVFDENAILKVAEVNQQVCAFISMNFVPQLAVDGDYARVSYFCVDEKYRSLKIGKTLLAHVELIAKAHRCDRVELRSAEHRKDAHRFYLNNGYVDSPKFFIKKFNNE